MTDKTAEFVGRGRGPLLHPIVTGIQLAACFSAVLMFWPRAGRWGRCGVAAGGGGFRLGLLQHDDPQRLDGRRAGVGVIVGLSMPRELARARAGGGRSAGRSCCGGQLGAVRGLQTRQEPDGPGNGRFRDPAAGDGPRGVADGARSAACGDAVLASICRNTRTIWPTDRPTWCWRRAGLTRRTTCCWASSPRRAWSGWGSSWPCWRSGAATPGGCGGRVEAPLWVRQQGLFFLAVLSAYLVNGMFHHIALIPMSNILLFFAAGMNAAICPFCRKEPMCDDLAEDRQFSAVRQHTIVLPGRNAYWPRDESGGVVILDSYRPGPPLSRYGSRQASGTYRGYPRCSPVNNVASLPIQRSAHETLPHLGFKTLVKSAYRLSPSRSIGIMRRLMPGLAALMFLVNLAGSRAADTRELLIDAGNRLNKAAFTVSSCGRASVTPERTRQSIQSRPGPWISSSIATWPVKRK